MGNLNFIRVCEGVIIYVRGNSCVSLVCYCNILCFSVWSWVYVDGLIFVCFGCVYIVVVVVCE